MTDKKTDAWMPLWIGAYLADTQHLTRDEHGAYFLLMMAYWRNKGPLQDDDKRLASIVKASSKEWKLIRPVLSEFFSVADGAWHQKRIDAELAGAGIRKDSALKKARAAAEARWGKSPKHPPIDAPSMHDAMHEDMHKECPTSHTNTTGIGIPTLVAKDEDGLDTHSACASPGEICKLIRAQGIADASPGHADLLMLLSVGATASEFESAAQSALKKKKGFGYVLGIVKKRREDAVIAAVGLHNGPMLTSLDRLSFAERDRISQMQRWEESTNQKHPDLPDEFSKFGTAAPVPENLRAIT